MNLTYIFASVIHRKSRFNFVNESSSNGHDYHHCREKDNDLSARSIDRRSKFICFALKPSKLKNTKDSEQSKRAYYAKGPTSAWNKREKIVWQKREQVDHSPKATNVTNRFADAVEPQEIFDCEKDGEHPAQPLEFKYPF